MVPWQDAAAQDVRLLAGGIPHAGLHVEPERAHLAEESLRDRGRRPRTVDPEIGDAFGALVPARQRKAGVVGVVVEVVVGEEEVVDLGRRKSVTEQLLGCRGTAIEQQPVRPRVHEPRAAEPAGSRSGSATTENMDTHLSPPRGVLRGRRNVARSAHTLVR